MTSVVSSQNPTVSLQNQIPARDSSARGQEGATKQERPTKQEELAKTGSLVQLSPSSQLQHYSLEGPQTLRTWLEQAQAKAKSVPTSAESLQVAAFSFLERHLRERLGIPQSEAVRIDFNPKMTRPAETNRQSEHAVSSVALNDLYPEFSGAGSMRVISLYEHPRLRVDQGYSSIVTVCVDYLHDRWCVSAVMLWAGPNTNQGKAMDLFLPKRDVQNVHPQDMPAYRNVLDTEYPAPKIQTKNQ